MDHNSCFLCERGGGFALGSTNSGFAPIKPSCVDFIGPHGWRGMYHHFLRIAHGGGVVVHPSSRVERRVGKLTQSFSLANFVVRSFGFFFFCISVRWNSTTIVITLLI